MNIQQRYNLIKSELPSEVTLCAVSKFHPSSSIEALYEIGQRDFGESRPQEMQQKAKELPQDIKWHFIGHLQTNKVAIVVESATIIESVDSLKLLQAISKEAQKQTKTTKVLLQLHIAQEQSKQGFDKEEIIEILQNRPYSGVEIVGLMGMATYTSDKSQVIKEFKTLESLYNMYPEFTTLSMGMSGDYAEAIECGANNVRIGSSIFGER